MSSGSALARKPADSARLASEVRLSVEQVSYAYSANPAQAPLFAQVENVSLEIERSGLLLNRSSEVRSCCELPSTPPVTCVALCQLPVRR